ncbi:hypothetical protein B9Z19DRAFT_1193183 [Tuber borchii]|uniref:Uncharacterized protein n=1 Tax=Tuber borchii TaxID=42251 RepID=A0A2T6ZT21_TUBBO|nr:hypothetical protein B9Z19DRAFT_1193183 [Tuber borchii]
MPIHRLPLRGMGIRTKTLGHPLRSHGSLAETLRGGDRFFDAILMTTSPIGPGTSKSMKHYAKGSLEKALNTEALEIKTVKKHLYIGNPKGLDLVGVFQRLETLIAEQKEITSLHGKISDQSEEISKQRQILDLTDASQEDRLRTLLDSKESYLDLRDRFVSIFKRDKLHNATRRDHLIIAQGNAIAHGGDITSDKFLYFTRRRTDPAAFKKLYGVLPDQLMCSEYGKTITLLNTHAGVVASDFTKTTSKKFSADFANFLMALKEAGYTGGYLDAASKSEVAIAHERFMNCLGTEVETSPPATTKPVKKTSPKPVESTKTCQSPEAPPKPSP